MQSTDLEDLNNYLNMIDPSVKKNVSIVSKEDVKQNYLLRLDSHIPRSVVKTITPIVPVTAALNRKLENRTLPRVSAGLNILDCLLGMDRLHTEFIKATNTKHYYINVIDFELAIKPNSKLLYDVDLTNEHWLVPYNKKTQKYTFKTIGHIFSISTTKTFSETTRHNRPVILIETYIMIDSDENISIDGKSIVKNGYYSFTYEKDNNVASRLVKITQKEYDDKLAIIGNNFAIESKTNSIINSW